MAGPYLGGYRRALSYSSLTSGRQGTVFAVIPCTMALETEQSITSLVRGVLDDGRELIREEVALAKAEARVEISRLTSAVTQFGAGAVAGWFALMFILCAGALGIATAFQWPPWTGFAIVGVLLGIVAGVMFMRARSAARRVEPMPRTLESVKENFR